MLALLKGAVLNGDEDAVRQITGDLLKSGVEPETILNGALQPAMDIVGAEYEEGKRYIPEMLISGEAMKASMEILHPLLVKTDGKSSGKVVVLGTVEGDVHDIGKGLVGMLLEGAGFEIIDLGTEVSAAQFVQAVSEHSPNILGMSALLTTTMIHMPEVIKALEDAGLRDKVKVMVGGAPVTEEYAEQTGADGYAPNAASAVKLARRLIGK